MGERALDVAFQRRGDVGDGRHFGHREGAVHRVDGPQQRIGDWLRTARGAIGQPGVHDLQVSGDFRLEDFQQHRVDGKHGAALGFALGHLFRCFGCLDGRLGLGLDCNFWLGSGFGRLLTRCDVAGFFAGGKQFRGCLDAVEVGMHRLALKRGAQQRQVIERQLHQRKHLRACRSTAVEHAVEQALDLPAEFAERLGAYQAAAALQRVEYATDRPQQLCVLRIVAPDRQQLREILDLLLEFLEEDFADLVVDFLAARAIEAGNERADGADCRRLGGRRPIGGKGLFRLEGGNLGSGADRGCGNGFGNRLGNGRLDHRLRRGRRGGLGRRGANFDRQRPVAKRRQALAGDFENLLAVRTPVAQGFEEILEAGQCIGQAIHLLAIGHAVAAQQFVVGELTHADQVVGRQRQVRASATRRTLR